MVRGNRELKAGLPLILVVCALAAGCKKSPATQGPPAGAPAAPKPGGKPAEQAANPGRYTLSKDKLDGYVKYQQALIGIYDTLLKELEKVPPPPADGGRPNAAEMNASMRILQNRAKAEEQARKDAGLSAEDVHEIEPVVTAVINKRSMARLFDAEAAIKQWEQMRKSVSESQRAEIDRTIADMKKQQEETEKLTEERKQYGDANVDLVLTREEELIKNQNAYLQRLSGRK